jgi:hypothetical protein
MCALVAAKKAVAATRVDRKDMMLTVLKLEKIVLVR